MRHYDPADYCEATSPAASERELQLLDDLALALKGGPL